MCVQIFGTDRRTDGQTDGQTEKFNTISRRFTGDNCITRCSGTLETQLMGSRESRTRRRAQYVTQDAHLVRDRVSASTCSERSLTVSWCRFRSDASEDSCCTVTSSMSFFSLVTSASRLRVSSLYTQRRSSVTSCKVIEPLNELPVDQQRLLATAFWSV